MFSDLDVSVNVTSEENSNIHFLSHTLWPVHPPAIVKLAFTLTAVHLLQVTKIASQNIYREELHISNALLFTMTVLAISCGVFGLWKVQNSVMLYVNKVIEYGCIPMKKFIIMPSYIYIRNSSIVFHNCINLRLLIPESNPTKVPAQTLGLNKAH